MAAGAEQLTLALLISTFTVIVRLRFTINENLKQTPQVFAVTADVTKCSCNSTKYAVHVSRFHWSGCESLEKPLVADWTKNVTSNFVPLHKTAAGAPGSTTIFLPMTKGPLNV